MIPDSTPPDNRFSGAWPTRRGGKRKSAGGWLSNFSRAASIGIFIGGLSAVAYGSAVMLAPRGDGATLSFERAFMGVFMWTSFACVLVASQNVAHAAAIPGWSAAVAAILVATTRQPILSVGAALFMGVTVLYSVSLCARAVFGAKLHESGILVCFASLFFMLFYEALLPGVWEHRAVPFRDNYEELALSCGVGIFGAGVIAWCIGTLNNPTRDETDEKRVSGTNGT